MRIVITIMMFLTNANYCVGQSMSLEQLKTAKWTKLDKGIEYIDIENKKQHYTDSIEFITKGFIDSSTIIPLDINDSIFPGLGSILKPILKKHLTDSKQGYLKINFYQLLQPEQVIVKIFLQDSYDTSNLNKDIEMIEKLPGIINVNYISKEKAKEEYLRDGNEDWDELLLENPLPTSINAIFNSKKIRIEECENLKTLLKESIPYISDIFSNIDYLTESKPVFYILEYNRY